MNNANCNIILDLLPGYIENDVTEDTKRFIENHLRECDRCRNILHEMKQDIIQEQDKIEYDTKVETEKIKKVKRNLKIHKNILVISSIVLLLLSIIFLYNQFNKSLYDKIQETYAKNQSLNNYHITQNVTYKNLVDGNGNFNFVTQLYCKDGNFKSSTYNADISLEVPIEIVYGEIYSREYTSIHVPNNEMVKIYNSNNLIPNELNGYKALIDNFKNQDLEIRIFQEKEWYVYTNKYQSGHIEYWIDKEQLSNIRMIESYNDYYRETSYIFEKNTATDEKMEINYDTTNFECKEINSKGIN